MYYKPMAGDVIQLIGSDITGIILFTMDHIPASMIEIADRRRTYKKIVSNLDFKILTTPQMQNRTRKTGPS